MVSRPRRTVARKATSPRALMDGASRLASTPEGRPGAGAPLSATARRRPLCAAKRPSTDRPSAIAEANTTVPSSPRAGTGCLPKPESRPTPATRSPSRATFTIFPCEKRNRPSSEPPRARVAKNATSPRAFTGATIGVASAPKRSKTPPPGAVSPVAATECRPTGSPAAAVARLAAMRPASRARMTRGWRADMRGSIGRPSGPRNDDADARALALARAAGRERRRHGARREAEAACLRRRLLLPGGRRPLLHRQPHRVGVPASLRRGALRRLVLEGATALLELGLRRVALAGPDLANVHIERSRHGLEEVREMKKLFFACMIAVIGLAPAMAL